MSLGSFHTLRLEPTTELLELIKAIRVVHHLQEMGMLGGKYGNAEANRRNAKIVEMRNALNLTRKELTMLVNIHISTLESI
jgi:hypothetical protein